MNLNRSGNTVTFEMPMFMLIVGTRAALGVGIGLLLADKLRNQRRAVGAALVAIGAVTTIPAAMAVIRARQSAELPDTTRQQRRVCRTRRLPEIRARAGALDVDPVLRATLTSVRSHEMTLRKGPAGSRLEVVLKCRGAVDICEGSEGNE